MERSWQRWDEASRIVQFRGWGKTPDRSWKSLSWEVSQSPAGHGKLGEMGEMGGNGGKWGKMGGNGGKREEMGDWKLYENIPRRKENGGKLGGNG